MIQSRLSSMRVCNIKIPLLFSRDCLLLPSPVSTLFYLSQLNIASSFLGNYTKVYQRLVLSFTCCLSLSAGLPVSLWAIATMLRAAEEARAVYTVAMDEVKFLVFGHTAQSIGTANLGGCSVVLIASRAAAILAHIAPRANGDPSDIHGGVRHVRNKMDEVAALYNANKHYFTGTNNWVVCAMHYGELALPDQQIIMTDCLTTLGLSSSVVTYEVLLTGRKRFPGQGTVYVDGSGGGDPVVYLEDKVISSSSNLSQYGAPSQKTQGATASSYGQSSTPEWAASSSYGASTYHYPEGTAISSYAHPQEGSQSAFGPYGSGPASYYPQGTSALSYSQLPALASHASSSYDLYRAGTFPYPLGTAITRYDQPQAYPSDDAGLYDAGSSEYHFGSTSLKSKGNRQGKGRGR